MDFVILIVSVGGRQTETGWGGEGKQKGEEKHTVYKIAMSKGRECYCGTQSLAGGIAEDGQKMTPFSGPCRQARVGFSRVN